ncbi:MAG: T9SS type A sorting domain-containing protein [Bacteroidota bacterium]
MKSAFQKELLAFVIEKLPISLVIVSLLILSNYSFANPPRKEKEAVEETASPMTVNVENFTGDPNGTTSFTGPSGEDFQLTGLMSVDSSPGDGTTGDDQWAGTALNTSKSNAIGTITLCESTKAFQVTGIDCWTSVNGGNAYASGDVTFVGYLHNGGTVSYTTTVTPTDNETGYDPITFAGTALDGEDLISLEFILVGSTSYLAVDSFAYRISSGLSIYNAVPTVSEVMVTGTLSKGSLLTATYDFDDCTDVESGSTHQWYRSDDANGTNKTAISGANTKNYTLTASDSDKFITYEVTPADANGSGRASTSSYYGPIQCGINNFAEDFEDNSGTSFTNNGQAFTLSGPSANITTFANYGWNGSSADDRYIDNDGEADNNDGGEITIETTDGTDIFVQSFWVWSAEDDYAQSATANLTITGKKDNVTQFSFTKSSGFNTSGNNGFTFINLATEGGSDYSETYIDELILSNAGAYEYIAIDGLSWATQTLSTSTLSTTAITTFDDNSATMGGEVTDDGCASVTEYGVVYNTTGSPTTADTKVAIGSGLGSYSQSITGLTASTQYYIRSFATNSEGTSYGSEQTFTTSATLPVELLSFNGTYQEGSVQLSWETATESQNKGYRVMRFTESAWQEIGFVAGVPENQEGFRAYQYTDEVKSQNGPLYYQLAQEDMDGSLNYSQVIEISREFEHQISIFPNPAKDKLTINSSRYELEEFQLYDLQGRLIARQTLSNKEAIIDLQAFAKGYYTVGIKLKGSPKVLRSLAIQ